MDGTPFRIGRAQAHKCGCRVLWSPKSLEGAPHWRGEMHLCIYIYVCVACSTAVSPWRSIARPSLSLPSFCFGTGAGAGWDRLQACHTSDWLGIGLGEAPFKSSELVILIAVFNVWPRGPLIAVVGLLLADAGPVAAAPHPWVTCHPAVCHVDLVVVVGRLHICAEPVASAPHWQSKPHPSAMQPAAPSLGMVFYLVFACVQSEALAHFVMLSMVDVVGVVG